MSNKEGVHNKLEKYKREWNYYIMNEQFHEALKIVDQYINKYPKDQYGYCEKGKILTKLKRYNEAILCFNKIHKINSRDIESYIQQAKVFLELKKYKQALWCCEYVNRNQINGFYAGELELKLQIHKKIISDMNNNGVFGHYYSFADVESIEYILLEEDFIKIIFPGQVVTFDINGDINIYTQEQITIGKLKQDFKNSMNSKFLEYITSDYELNYYYNLNDETFVRVVPVYYLNEGDTILSNYFTTNYQWDNYIYEEGMYEVLFGSYCLGYVLKK